MPDDWARDCNGESAFGYHFPDAFGRALFQVNGDTGKTLLVFGQQSPQKWIGGWADVTQAQFAFFAGGSATDATQRFFELVKKLNRFAQEDRTGRCQPDVVASAFEKNGAEFGFELFNGAAEGGLRDVKAAGRAGKAEFFGDSAEIL